MCARAAPPSGTVRGPVLESASLRSDEYPAPRRRIVVDDALKMGDQPGDTMHLVDDRTVWKLRQVGHRVVGRESPFVQGFKGSVGVSGKQGPAQPGLTALPGTGEHDDDRTGRC